MCTRRTSKVEKWECGYGWYVMILILKKKEMCLHMMYEFCRYNL